MEDDTFHQFHQSYPTSNARSEPFPTCTSTRHWIVSPSSQPPSPPLWTAPPPPVKIKQGIWRDGEDILRSSDWPPVQQYLSETRWNKTLAPAPSEIVFALAALEVLHQPYNPVHWLFWGAGPLSNTSKTVNRIALHRPRLIKTDVPWIGISEYKRVIFAIQEKWEYVYVRKRWYPVDDQPETSTKRLLRSSSDRADRTINDYFNLPDVVEPPSKRARRAGKKAVETQDPCLVDRAKQSKVAVAAPNVASVEAHMPTIRTSTRRRPKTTPSTSPAPPFLPAPPFSSAPSPAVELAVLPPVLSFSLASTNATVSDPCLISSPSSAHSRNRSTSQSSAETLVDSDQVQMRSGSVTSTDTAVGNPLSKKRKLEAVERCDVTVESNRREGMVTRGRASKFRLVETNIEKSVRSISPSKIPTKKDKTVAEKPKARAKKSRVKK